ncbi:pyruvate, phosphate dikinase [Glycomyces albidus]|uniref:Pyruvate, phosphate dikinase n=1 Tax=Glycomyces albidus TaxID=2656774 RepID=A0A6L5GCQ2_9ACTN|nr:pyruvate, phosphate dikinase [Glycomyces albidus]MQM27477.1 pyruvate, phosphate dikinase [Glycomyces albidus]
MKWIRTIDAATAEGPETLGAKAHGLVALHRLGLPVPAGFVVVAEACREYLRDGRFPDGLREELAAGVAALEQATGRRFGGARRPLAVAVRSGSAVSMPGMMDTILDLGLTSQAEAGLAAETGNGAFAASARRRLLDGFAAFGASAPDDAALQLEAAVAAVFDSWNAPRARTYRDLNAVPHDLGTAVIVQAMVFGDRDDRSGTGIAFSRDPNTGAPEPYGDVLFGHQGEDAVSGRTRTLPLDALADREPAVWDRLADALHRIEARLRDACYVEFTFESGELWLLQTRPGRFTGAAAVRAAVDLADEGRITRSEALLRVSPGHLTHARTPRIADDRNAIARGIGACPGVATGRIATTVEAATRMAADGPVILVRPETSPHDMSGLAVAAGVVTERGGPASHAAVVARAMNRPAVVGATGLVAAEGDLVTIDGTSGAVVRGRAPVAAGAADDRLRRLLDWADDASGRRARPDGTPRGEAERLRAAHDALRR